MIRVINKHGHVMDYETTYIFMDREIRERLQRELVNPSEQDFFSAYEEEHLKKFNKEWELSQADPIW